MSNFDGNIKPLNFQNLENNGGLFLIILVKFWISGGSVVYLENSGFENF